MLDDFLLGRIQFTKSNSNIIIIVLFTLLFSIQILQYFLLALEFVFLLFHKLFQTIKIGLTIAFRHIAVFFINDAIIQHLP